MQGCKKLRIFRQRHSFLYIACRIRYRQILQPEIGEDAKAEARAVRISLERDDGNTHVERVERRAAAGIGERIESDVYVVILMEVFTSIGAQLGACRLDACRLQPLKCGDASLLARKGGRFQEQTRVRNGCKNLRPHRERLVRSLGEGIETAEGHEAFLQAWRSARRRCVRLGRIAEVRMCKHEQFLRKERCFLDARRRTVEPYVADHIVDRGKPCRREVADA